MWNYFGTTLDVLVQPLLGLSGEKRSDTISAVLQSQHFYCSSAGTEAADVNYV